MSLFSRWFPKLTTTVSGEDTEIGVCLRCGCFVPDIRLELHQTWHGSIDRETR